MEAAEYDAWYDTPRGAWIGNSEYALARRELAASPGETLLDVGCGTGWFTRRFAAEGLRATGLDPNPEWLAHARTHSGLAMRWVEGDARRLPFPDAAFDCVTSIAALCFIDDEHQALAEIVRVARRRFVVGWLNRNSLLYPRKRERGAYHGARWHTPDEIRGLFDGLPVSGLHLRSAIFLPDGGPWARLVETLAPKTLPFGAMVFAAGNKTSC